MDITKDKELVRAYKKEAQELLGVIRKSVTNLQKGRDKKTVYPALSTAKNITKARKGGIYRLFRCSHTLKEISGGIGFKEIERMADQLLEMSRAIKNGREGLNNDTAPLLRERINACQGLLDKELR